MTEAPWRLTMAAYEVIQGAGVAVLRQAQNIRWKSEGKFGINEDEGWDKNINGSLAEMATAKCLDKYWSGNIGDIKAPDVGKYEVRWTPDHNNKLILHKPYKGRDGKMIDKDRDDAIFILVTGRCPDYWLRGWIMGCDGKKEEFWKDPVGDRGDPPRPAYFVPVDRLEPMDTLP